MSCFLTMLLVVSHDITAYYYLVQYSHVDVCMVAVTCGMECVLDCLVYWFDCVVYYVWLP